MENFKELNENELNQVINYIEEYNKRLEEYRIIALSFITEETLEKCKRKKENQEIKEKEKEEKEEKEEDTKEEEINEEFEVQENQQNQEEKEKDFQKDTKEEIREINEEQENFQEDVEDQQNQEIEQQKETEENQDKEDEEEQQEKEEEQEDDEEEEQEQQVQQEQEEEQEQKEEGKKYDEKARTHSFLTRALYLGGIYGDDYKYYCDLSKEDNSDWVNHVTYVLSDFGFWPTSKKPMNNVIFWSENHTFMYLSSAYLFVQQCGDKYFATYYDQKHLLAYLNGHCHEDFSGVYEVLSATYLPFTLCSLLNLYDFANDLEVKAKSLFLINKIINTFTLVTNKSGICNLTASARQYPRTRVSNFGLNINQLIYLVTGATIDRVRPTSIIDFLLTSTWRPSYEAYTNFMLPNEIHYHPDQPNVGFFETLKMNHATKAIKNIYKFKYIKESDTVPFYWSAGLVTHPNYIDDTMRYKTTYKLDNNPGIRELGYLPSVIARTVMHQNNHYSKGQNYTKIWLSIYKSPTRKIIMTSFREYNVGLQAYQQMPWMVNFDGIGIWSQSGQLLGHECINVYGPSIKQYHNILLVVYAMHHTAASDNSISLFWPMKYFDYQLFLINGGYVSSLSDQLDYEYMPSWWFGVRDDCYIGVYCSRPTTVDYSKRSDCNAQYLSEQESYLIPRRKTTHKKVYWIVVVGDTKTHVNIGDFVQYCENLRHLSEKTSNDKFTVKIPSVNLETTVNINSMCLRI